MTADQAKTTLRLGDYIRVGNALGYDDGMVTELTQSHFLLRPQDDRLATKAISWTTNDRILRTTPSGTLLPEPPPPDTYPAEPAATALRERAEKAEARASGYQRDADLWYKRWDADNSRAEKAEAERDTWRNRAAIVDPLVGRAQKAEAYAIAQRERADQAEAHIIQLAERIETLREHSGLVEHERDAHLVRADTAKAARDFFERQWRGAEGNARSWWTGKEQQRTRAERAEAERDDLHTLADITRKEHGHQYGLANNALTQALTETAALRARVEEVVAERLHILGHLQPSHGAYTRGVHDEANYFADIIHMALADPQPEPAAEPEPHNLLLGADFGTDPPTFATFVPPQPPDGFHWPTPCIADEAPAEPEPAQQDALTTYRARLDTYIASYAATWHVDKDGNTDCHALGKLYGLLLARDTLREVEGKP